VTQSVEKLQSKVMNLRSSLAGERRRLEFLESELADPRAHEKHVDRLYQLIVKAWRCTMFDGGECSENWRHEANGDDCMGELARCVPDRYWREAGVLKRHAESTRWPISEAVHSAVCEEGG
jgi:hypothetical protein